MKLIFLMWLVIILPLAVSILLVADFYHVLVMEGVLFLELEAAFDFVRVELVTPLQYVIVETYDLKVVAVLLIQMK